MAFFSKELSLETVFTTGEMVQSMLVFGKTMKLMDSVSLYRPMAVLMLDNGARILKQAWVCRNGVMAVSSKENLLMTKNMDMVFMFGAMEGSMQVTGPMVSSMA